MKGGGTKRIELVVPGTRRNVRLVRLLAGGVASAYGPTTEMAEDARLAVDEVCGWLVDVGRGAPLTVSFFLQDDVLLIRSSTEEAVGATHNQRRLDLSRRILEAIAGRTELTRIDGQAVFTVSIPLRR